MSKTSMASLIFGFFTLKSGPMFSYKLRYIELLIRSLRCIVTCTRIWAQVTSCAAELFIHFLLFINSKLVGGGGAKITKNRNELMGPIYFMCLIRTHLAMAKHRDISQLCNVNSFETNIQRGKKNVVCPCW